MEGWIKVHRRLMEKGWYAKPEYLALWVHILMKANHNEREFWFNGQNVKVKRGQFVTGRNKLSQETGISPSKVERILKVFKSEQQIEQQTNNHNRLITVVCYDQYQKSEQPNDQPVNNQWTASEQPVDTNKNERIKEPKNDKKIEDADFQKFILLFNKIRKSQFKGCVKSKAFFKARVKEGYTFGDFEKAIKASMLEEHHIKHNFKYLTPEFITRNDKLEMYLNRDTKPLTEKTPINW